MTSFIDKVISFHYSVSFLYLRTSAGVNRKIVCPQDAYTLEPGILVIFVFRFPLSTEFRTDGETFYLHTHSPPLFLL